MRYLQKSRMRLLLFFVLLTACEERETLTPVDKSLLRQVIEHRYTPKDSVTIVQDYSSLGNLTEEKYSTQYLRRAYSVNCLYSPTDASTFKNANDQYRIYFSTGNLQPATIKQYFYIGSSAWAVYESDSLFYQKNQLINQKHWDYAFVSDGQTLAFQHPLWYTKRMVEHDAKQRVVTEVDSIYITHDLAVGSLAIQPAEAKYVFTNKVNYQYNDRNELTQKQTISGSDEKPSLSYSNGVSIYNQFGLNWTTYAKSWPGRFATGNTTYRYEYDAGGRLTKKQAIFTDKFGQSYTSVFHYQYR